MERSVISGVLPDWALPKEQVTVDDFVRSGACAEGVREYADEHHPGETAVLAESLPSKGVNSDYINKALHLAGNGYGYGDGEE